MTQNRRSVLATLSDGDQIDRNQLNGLVAVLVGLSQLLLVLVPLSDPEHLLLSFVVGSGGMLLIFIGIHVFQDKEAFEIEANVSNRVIWLDPIIRFIFTIGVVAAAVSVSFGVAWLNTVAWYTSIFAFGFCLLVATTWFLFR